MNQGIEVMSPVETLQAQQAAILTEHCIICNCYYSRRPGVARKVAYCNCATRPKLADIQAAEFKAIHEERERQEALRPRGLRGYTGTKKQCRFCKGYFYEGQSSCRCLGGK